MSQHFILLFAKIPMYYLHLSSISTLDAQKSGYQQQKCFIKMLKITVLLKLAVPMGRTLSCEVAKMNRIKLAEVISKSTAPAPSDSIQGLNY